MIFFFSCKTPALWPKPTFIWCNREWTSMTIKARKNKIQHYFVTGLQKHTNEKT
jgi:hypothetical protein